MFRNLRIYTALLADSKKYIEGINCEECNEASQQVRHCPFIDRALWKGDIKYVVNCAHNKQELLDCCPVGFLKQNEDLKIYLDCYYATEKGLPLWSNIGFLEYPNLIVTAMEIVAEEINWVQQKGLELGK